MAGFVLSNIVGLVNRMLYTRAFGTGAELDAFFAANKLPDILFNLMAGGALASAFLPAFAGLLTRQDQRSAWRLASSVGNLLLLGLGIAAALVWLAAPWIVPNLLVPGFDDPALIELTIDLLRIQLAAPVIFGISGLVMAVLNAHQHFALPGLAPTFHWAGWILGTLLLAPRFGPHGLAWGVVLGATLHLVVQLPGLRRIGARYKPTLGIDDPTVRQVGRLMVPRLFGVAVVQINFWINIILASGMPEGSLTGITLGFAIMLMPQVVIAQALAIAALPTFSAQVAQGHWEEMRSSLAATLRTAIFLSLPASIGLVLLRRPVVAMLFQRGEFDSNSTELVAWALLWYAAGLIGHAVVEIASRAYYALQDTRTPVLIGAATMTLNVVLSLVLSSAFPRVGWAPHGGLAMANTLATGLEAAVLLWLLRHRIDFGHIRGGLLGSVVAAGALALALLLWSRILEDASVWLVGLGGVLVGGVVYWGMALLARAPEAREFPATLFTRRPG
jgi:putative peptidoglycan lipid II flippase